VALRRGRDVSDLHATCSTRDHSYHGQKEEAAVTRLILVRHGETEWNRVERFRGRADVPLNSTGLAQAEASARRIRAGWQVTAVYCSPLSRAAVTASALAAPFQLTATPLQDLIDIDYGEWQGKSPEEVGSLWPDLLSAWYKKPHTVRIPGGESLDDVRARCGRVLRQIAAQHREGSVVVVAHTVINRVILLEVLSLGNDRFWRIRQDPCAINEIEGDGEELTLVSMNDTCYLRGQ
jgi:probable phosphoglycerate mutase